jgi:hypothetical protein
VRASANVHARWSPKQTPRHEQMTTEPPFEEMMNRHAAAMAEQARNELENASALIGRFTERAKMKGVFLGASSFEYIPTIGIVAKAPGLAKALIGSIHIEHDGLIAYKDLVPRLPPSRFNAGYFVGSDYMVMAHPCFRRQMQPAANWAPNFIELLWRFEQPGVAKYIAIDENRVRINVDGSVYIERDAWYGAPFDDDVRNIKAGVVKLRPPLDLDPHHLDFLFAKVYCLDVKWSEGGGVKTYQSLELKTEDVQIEIEGKSYFPARYLHAEFDIAANRFRHFDGAIQYFLRDEYLQRRDSDFNMTAKNSEHIKARSKKVFKLNGLLKTEIFVELCSHFYTANPLIFEYFSGSYPAHITDFLSKLESRNVSNNGCA